MNKKNLFAAAALTVTFAITLMGGTGTANACIVGVNCNQPTGVGKGNKVPVWTVQYCVVGKGDSRKTVNCKSKKAVHRSPTGNLAVCFIGSDGKEHWDYQREVHPGRPFKNVKIAGRWQPDWQDARPY